MVWVECNRPVYEKWLKNTRRTLGIRPDGYKDVWQLVALLKKKRVL